MIYTFSKFNYGINVDQGSYALNFTEGGPELTAEISAGSYTLGEFVVAIEAALNSAGALTYTVSVARATNIITISATGAFNILLLTGTNIGVSFAEMAGFTQTVDLTGASSYSGASAAGSQYRPQFLLQSYVPSTSWRSSTDVTVNRTASGRVEVVRFGTERFIEMDIKFITDLPMDNTVIRNNPNGLGDALDFLNSVTQKNRFEFVEDVNDPSVFEKVIVESLPNYSDGTGFKLRELFVQNLPDIYETGVMKLRVIS